MKDEADNLTVDWIDNGFHVWYEAEYEKGNFAPSACDAWQFQQKIVNEAINKLNNTSSDMFEESIAEAIEILKEAL